ncbi:hypoxanthine-guanine phosphoribosyltransferase-like [Schistocerca gregaria]|uniref:hypoxanthine-guanine phosphoribosyltransferase-like n=1 Tax=Schistocerca gregaria TaxID=7010 RepID=UPI00211EA31B|nr:hypoxanthine-guanine phosphoribosyltransferase-like [Schistocerca gregaria]
MDPNIEVVFDADAIAARIKSLADIINQDYADTRELVLVCILKGAAIFAADLLRKIRIPCRLEFMAVSSYEDFASSNTVQILLDLKHDIAGTDVLLVEDILDTGLTLKKIHEMLKNRSPKSLKTVCLLKKHNQKICVNIEYVGFELHRDMFVIGYGMDYAERYRELDYIGAFRNIEQSP